MSFEKPWSVAPNQSPNYCLYLHCFVGFSVTSCGWGTSPVRILRLRAGPGHTVTDGARWHKKTVFNFLDCEWAEDASVHLCGDVRASHAGTAWAERQPAHVQSEHAGGNAMHWRCPHRCEEFLVAAVETS